jgi:hypothetical protein
LVRATYARSRRPTREVHERETGGGVGRYHSSRHPRSFLSSPVVLSSPGSTPWALNRVTIYLTKWGIVESIVRHYRHDPHAAVYTVHPSF